MSITKRLDTTQLLFKSASHKGLRPSWVIPNSLFVMDTSDGEKYVRSSHSPLNSCLSMSLAKNKYFTRTIMERYGLPNIPYGRPQTLQEAEAFLAAHSTIVVKPVSGSGSCDIHIVTDMSQIEGLNIQKYIFEKYVAGQEMRYLILNNQVIGVYESEYGNSVAVDRDLRCNAHRRSDWNPELVDLSLQITSILGLHFGTVDFMIAENGQAYILEVNSTPDLKWFHAPSTGPSVDVASMYIESMLEDIDARFLRTTSNRHDATTHSVLTTRDRFNMGSV